MIKFYNFIFFLRFLLRYEIVYFVFLIFLYVLYISRCLDLTI